MASQYDLDKQARLDEQNAIKAKHGQQVIEEQEKVEPIVPKTFKQKWDNYWYHYKALTIGLTFLSILVIMFGYSMLFPAKYDATLTIVTNMSFNGAEGIIEKGMLPILQDYDGNGKKSIAINPLQYNLTKDTDQDPTILMANQTKLMAMMSSIENFLFIVDKDNYDTLTEMGIVFADLTPFTKDENASSKFLYGLKDTELSKQLGLHGVLDDMNLCLVDLESYGEKRRSNKKARASYENERDLLQRMIAIG